MVKGLPWECPSAWPLPCTIQQALLVSRLRCPKHCSVVHPYSHAEQTWMHVNEASPIHCPIREQDEAVTVMYHTTYSNRCLQLNDNDQCTVTEYNKQLYT